MLPWEGPLLIFMGISFIFNTNFCVLWYTSMLVSFVSRTCCSICVMNIYIYINEGLMVYVNRVLVIQSLILENFVLNDSLEDQEWTY